MSDDKSAESQEQEAQEAVGGENQQEAMPAPEQNPTEEVSAPQEEPKVEPEADEEKVALENSKNPERTKKYIEKLKSELNELKSKAQQPTVPEAPAQPNEASVFDALRPPIPPAQEQPMQNQYQFLNQGQVESITNKFVSPDGTVDIEGLNRELAKANERSRNAEISLLDMQQKMARFEESQQERNAYAVHPELNPMDKGRFDPKFRDLVADRLFKYKMTGRENLSNPSYLLSVANEVRDAYNPIKKDVVKQEAVKEYKEAQKARIQGPLESGKGQPRQQADADYEDLRARTRKNDDSALTERLKRAGVTFPSER